VSWDKSTVRTSGKRSGSEKPQQPVGNARIKITIPIVLTVEGHCFAESPEKIMSMKRAGGLAEARHWVYYILWRSGMKVSHIGRRLGRHHSSILHGVNCAKERLTTYEGKTEYDYICKRLARPECRESV
jgi:chromosomal replication initiation ATPase DnaA